MGKRDLVGKTVREALPEIVKQGFTELLDGVYRSGEPYLGAGAAVKLQRQSEAPAEDGMVDFIYQPMRDANGAVDGIFVLVTDVTERARAEAAPAPEQLAAGRGTRAARIDLSRRSSAPALPCAA